ncbi:MAG: hypothetical protein JWO66_665 [Candidatus Eremiobacteraeota bacterium]|nr:hypothetical protein [Candidatus Eremiobacteraeota bacterium]
MKTAVAWDRSYRIIAARLPRIDIFEDVADPADLDAVLRIEALTNPRIRDLEGAIRVVPPDDRVTGPGATFVMAPFAYPRASRFTDGSFGVYYAGETIETAVAEHGHHRARFLADTAEPPGVFDHRVIEASIEGALDDVARERRASALLDPDGYDASQAYGAKRNAAGSDGLVWPSVRRRGGTCVGLFKPRLVRNAHSAYYLGYRWDGTSISDVFRMESLTGTYPSEPPTR